MKQDNWSTERTHPLDCQVVHQWPTTTNQNRSQEIDWRNWTQGFQLHVPFMQTPKTPLYDIADEICQDLISNPFYFLFHPCAPSAKDKRREESKQDKTQHHTPETSEDSSNFSLKKWPDFKAWGMSERREWVSITRLLPPVRIHFPQPPRTPSSSSSSPVTAASPFTCLPELTV